MATRVRSFSAALSLMQGHLQGEERRKALASLAEQAGREAAAKNRAVLGMDVPQETIVDGRRGAPVSSVRAGGVVVHLFAVQQAAVEFTLQTLRSLSPVDMVSPDNIVYRDNHVMLVNGKEVPPGTPIGPDDVVSFTNLLAYARRIEQGWSKLQAPDGVYEAASEIVRARFGSIVTVRFTYASFVGDHDSDSRYPTIILLPKRRRA